MDVLQLLSSGFVSFAQNIVGIAVKPYETYRRITKQGTGWECVYIALLLLIYFAIASLVKTAAFRPYLLTKQFVVLFSAAACTYLVVSVVLWVVARFFGAMEQYKTFAIGWAYTLVPTVAWFLLTSILYVILPPPRTTSTAGVVFSLVYLSISTTLFLWKVIHGYLSLRFALKLDLKRILLTVGASSPVVGAYGVLMYKLGVFKVPFI